MYLLSVLNSSSCLILLHTGIFFRFADAATLFASRLQGQGCVWITLIIINTWISCISRYCYKKAPISPNCIVCICGGPADPADTWPSPHPETSFDGYKGCGQCQTMNRWMQIKLAVCSADGPQEKCKASTRSRSHPFIANNKTNSIISYSTETTDQWSEQ